MEKRRKFSVKDPQQRPLTSFSCTIKNMSTANDLGTIAGRNSIFDQFLAST